MNTRATALAAVSAVVLFAGAAAIGWGGGADRGTPDPATPAVEVEPVAPASGAEVRLAGFPALQDLPALVVPPPVVDTPDGGGGGGSSPPATPSTPSTPVSPPADGGGGGGGRRVI